MLTLWERLSLRRKIIALASGLVLLSILAGATLLVYGVGSAVEKELGQRVMSVARAVAQVDGVKQALENPAAPFEIQPIAERMRLATGVEYIVVIDMNRVRRSHPVQDRIGRRFEGGDEGLALAEQAYVTPAFGVNGPSVRAFMPIMDSTGRHQVGVAVVGMLVPSIPTLLMTYHLQLGLALVGALGVGVLGAWLLAGGIKRQMFDMEPREIARLLEERVSAFSSITEGLIAIDRQNRITLMNDECRRILDLPPNADVIGRDIYEVVPFSRLPEVIRTEQGVRNQQMLFGRHVILTSRLPIYVKGKIVGALATFRDRTEFHHLAEELTGVTNFVDAVRAQNHESMNKLHTIAGMIQMKKYNQALDFIFSITEQQQELSRFLARSIKDYRVSGLILGKVTRSRELAIELVIDRQSRLDEIPVPLEVNDLVLIIGNLLENAMDAVGTVPLGARRVHCLVRGGRNGLEIRVEDNGCGLPDGVPSTRIFDQGYSTKGINRGIGLALVRQIVDFAGGQIQVESVPGNTVFRIWLPGGNTSAAD